VIACFDAPNRAGAEAYWYYCDQAHAYYPYVTTCPGPWRPVVANAQPQKPLPVTPPASTASHSPKPAKAAPVPLAPAAPPAGAPTAAAISATPAPAPQKSDQSQGASPADNNNNAAEWIEIGNHAGENARVVRKSGLGTEDAEVGVIMDMDREIHACSEEYLGDPPDAEDKTHYDRCVDYAKSTFTGPYHMTARANCSTGEMWGFRPQMNLPSELADLGPEPSRFYVGQIHHSDLGTGTSATSAGYDTHVFDYQGFRVPDAGYTDVGTDGDIFRKLCPNSFIGPPKSDPPELDLDFDCKAALPEAERIATQAGLSHLMNVSIIDAWDAKSEGTTWWTARCAATILLNTSAQARLEYEKVSIHGHYFIRTNIIQ